MRGLFYGIGHMPNSGIVAGQVDLDEKGYVKVPPAASLHCILQKATLQSNTWTSVDLQG